MKRQTWHWRREYINLPVCSPWGCTDWSAVRSNKTWRRNMLIRNEVDVDPHQIKYRQFFGRKPLRAENSYHAFSRRDRFDKRHFFFFFFHGISTARCNKPTGPKRSLDWTRSSHMVESDGDGEGVWSKFESRSFLRSPFHTHAHTHTERENRTHIKALKTVFFFLLACFLRDVV